MIVITSRAAYGRLKQVILKLKVPVVLTTSAILCPSIKKELIYLYNIRTFEITDTLTQTHSLANMATTTGYLTAELARVFEQTKPKFVLAHADRYETLAVAIAASYQNIVVAHTQGGEITGTIDESVRHSVTKLSHVHFPATDEAARNIAKMGEIQENIHKVGCPSLDTVKLVTGRNLSSLDLDSVGSGAKIDLKEPFLLVLQHPVTTEYKNAVQSIQETVKAISDFGMQTIWLWPNIDAGTDEISKYLRVYRDNYSKNVRFFDNFSPEDYYTLLNHCACLVGNSSSGIREGSFLGTPVVNIGSRQEFRETAGNVTHVPHNREHIARSINFQIQQRYKQSFLYGDGNAAGRIVKVLSKPLPKIQKRLNYGL